MLDGQRVFTEVGGPLSSWSNWLAMSTDGNTLYASNADENALFLLDTSVPIDPAQTLVGPPVTGGPIALAGPPGPRPPWWQ